jgi:hypothetical protein
MTKHNFIDIIKIFQSKNCELLTLEKDYFPLMSLDYKCECGNISKIKLKNFKLRTHGCKKCFGKNNNQEYIKICQENQCEFIDKYPEKTSIKIKFKCKCGEIQIKNITQFKKSTMYTKCTYKIRSVGRRNTIEYIKKEFEKKNCKLLSTEYTNAFQRLDYICSCGNKTTIRYNDLQQGRKCNKCEIERRISTNLKKYGCVNPMQNLEIFNKSNKNAKKLKIYKYNNGKEIKVQGYEPLALSLLENKYKINSDDIITQFDNEIYYTFIKKYHKYFPDIYIKSLNKIIEVKSDYMYVRELQKNLMKKKACLYLGYTFEFWIFDRKHNLTII